MTPGHLLMALMPLVPGRSQATPVHCRTRCVRLREEFELGEASCEALADYQRFVDWAMQE